MEIIKKYINKNEMIRSGENLKKVKYIVIHEALEKNSDIYHGFDRIKNLSLQDDIYYSVHYIIDSDGRCLNIIPENEVSYSTSNIELNYNIISIECFCKNQNGEFSMETIEMLVKLLSYLKKKYKLSNSDIVLHYDLTGTRRPKFYIDNKFKFYNILNEVK